MSGPMFLLVGLLLQGSGPTVILSVDRDRVAPGELVTLTIKAVSSSPDAIRVELPALGGFQLESRAERTEITPGPSENGRTTVVELRLRAVAPGEWRLGPIAARQGIAFAVADPVSVTIIGGGVPAVASGITPRVAKLLERAPPPVPIGETGFTVALSDSSVTAGEQVDVVTMAWFERGLRERLRRAPSLVPPTLEGMWSYNQPAATGIAASRIVNGRTYDLFVRHQVAFPLAAGRLSIATARLEYSVPLSYQFFSQEERFELSSRPFSIAVAEPPAAGREPGFGGAIGQDISLSVRVDPAVARERDAVTATVEVRGWGNVALWPQPAVSWPAGLRVYPEGAEESTRLNNGWLGGSKRFRFLIIPDSSGTLIVSTVRYPYYDPVRGRYQLASAEPVRLVVSASTRGLIARAEPPPIRFARHVALSERIRGALSAPVWWILFLAGPVVALLRRPRQRRVRAEEGPRPTVDAVQATESRLHLRVSAILGHVGEPLSTAAALHDAGVPRDTADRVGNLLDRFRAARFSASPGDTAELLRDTELVLKRLHGTTARRGRSLRRRIALSILLPAVTAQAAAQVSPQQLYQAGAYGPAAREFEREAAADPLSPNRWYNLGAARYRAGEDAAALAAWVVAARLEPRERATRRALALVPPAVQVPRQELWTSPITPGELWLLAGIMWMTAWVGIAVERRARGRWMVLVCGSLLCFGAAEGVRQWYMRPLAIARSSQVLRTSPHNLAPSVGELSALEVVHLKGWHRRWIRLASAGGQEGWVAADALVPILRPSRE